MIDYFEDCKTCPHKSPTICPCKVIKVIEVSDSEIEDIIDFVTPNGNLQ